MKKHLLALAASAFAFIASAATGNIYSIDPIDPVDVGKNFESGEKIQFRVRLLSPDYANPAPKGWALDYASIGSTNIAWALKPLKFGIVVSGRLAAAEVVDLQQHPVKVGSETAYPYTDLICEYKVKAGDLALPVLLALKGSTDVKPVTPGSDDATSNEYYVFNSDIWSLVGVNEDASPALCRFYFCDPATATDARSNWMTADIGSQTRDYSLSQCNFRAKAIGFDGNMDNPGAGYWRVVSETTTQTTYRPTIVTVGSPAEDAQDLYVWSKDETAVVMAGDAQKMGVVIDRAGNTTEKMVAIVKIRSGVTEYPITIKGVAQGKGTELVLSPVLGYQFDTAGNELTNYLTVKVYCSEPPSPNIQLSFDPANPTSAKNKTVDTSMKTTESLSDDAVPVYVTVSEPSAADFTLQIAVKNEGAPTVDPITNRNISVSQYGDAFTASDNSYTNLTIKAGETSAVFYVYPLGGDTATQMQGISFTPVLPDPTVASRYDLGARALLRIKRAPAPTIVVPEFGADIGLVSPIDGFALPLQLSACYRDLHEATGGFGVDVKSGSSTLYSKEDILFRESDPTDIEINEGLSYDPVNPRKLAKITVKTPDGRVATSEFYFTVQATKTMSAQLYDSTAEGSQHVGSEFNEGDAPIVRITLSESLWVGEDRWAFLVPQNAASSNLVDCAAFTEGVLIPGGQTNSYLNIKWALRLNDGCAMSDGTSGILSYKVVLRTSDSIDEDEDNIDESFTATEPLQLTVRNVYPTTEGVFVNGSPNEVANGSHWPIPVSSGVKVPFNLNVSDVSINDQTNGLISVFCFTDGRRSDTWKYQAITTGVDRVSCDHVFSSPGSTQTVQVVTIDKDLLASLTTKPIAKPADLQTLWPSLIRVIKPYTFTVGVSSKPHVAVETYGFNRSRMDETGNDKMAKLRITLSEIVDEDVTVRVIAKPAADSNWGKLEFATDTYPVDPLDPSEGVYTELTIKQDANEPASSSAYTLEEGLKFKYSSLNGTAGSSDYGWEIQAKVMAGPDDTYYNHFAAAEGLMIYVDNAAPKLNNKTQEEINALVVTTNKSVAIGQNFTITWKPSDVLADVDATWQGTANKGLRSMWYINDVAQPSLTKYVTRPASSTEIPEQTTTLSLVEEGLSIIRLVVTDVDGEDYNGAIERSWYYYIAPTKKLSVKPVSPVGNSQTKYLRFPGIGTGRVYANGGTVSVAGFAQTWTYDIRAAQAEAYAYGYASAAEPYADDGTLGPRDVALDVDGEQWTATSGKDYWKYDLRIDDGHLYDNYFYRWAYIILGENGGASTVEYGNLQPTTVATAQTAEPIQLDPWEDGKESYLTRFVEAVFSRELLWSDNLGDINADYVPDVYLSMYPKLGVVTEEGVMTGDDRVDIGKLNPDDDYLPNTFTAEYAGFIPGLSNTWVTVGRPFTTRQEIRGYDDNFNDGTAQAKILGVKVERSYLDPEIVGTTNSTLSHLEYVAFTNWCGRVAGTNEDQYVALTNGMGWTKWSPERPTDPTVVDTDDDGMPDGYEYYFWYKAHVGTIDENGEYKRMTGRKYIPALPLGYQVIPADMIEQIFDPLVANDEWDTRDTDYDGIPDKIEFMIGTNPVDFDTDGDGLPDGYELYVTKTDPLLLATEPGVLDCERNDDFDQRATAKVNVYGFDYEITNTVDGVEICETNRLYTLMAPPPETDENDHFVEPVDLFTTFLYEHDRAEDKDIFCLGGIRYSALDDAYVITNVLKVISVNDLPIEVDINHWQVFTLAGFDPRVAWNVPPCSATHRVLTKSFRNWDEYMLIAFAIHTGGIPEGAYTGLLPNELVEFWGANATDPLNADTDADGMPDGWELYVMAPGKLSGVPTGGIYGPLYDFGLVDGPLRDPDADGLDFRQEYDACESCDRYPECETIKNGNAKWQNKVWPTDPWGDDTDGDGLLDGEEQEWIFGDETRGDNYDMCVEGGGLNPCSWDTDNDNLPDPWELEFCGTYTKSTTTTTVETTSDTNGTTSVTNSVTTGAHANADGMNPTTPDEMLDYDHDGLNNWQEYMVGAMRCWRYDDLTSPWISPRVTNEDIANNLGNGEWFYRHLVDYWGDQTERGFEHYQFNPGLRNDIVNPGLYFTLNTKAFDLNANGKFYMFKDGINHDLSRDIRMGMNRWTNMALWNDIALSYSITDPTGFPLYPRFYITCDPRLADTDGDGMDDYYELYHGLNPLLGLSRNVREENNEPRDIIYEAYKAGMDDVFPWSADNNYWISGGAVKCGTICEVKPGEFKNTNMNFMHFPWLAGLPSADPDGDNIRNQQESILPNTQAAATYQHTDPTPLWMTDLCYTNSLTARFYQADTPEWAEPILPFKDPQGGFWYRDRFFPWNDIPGFTWDPLSTVVTCWYSVNMFGTNGDLYSFEENEGYDTDHDYLSDFEESQGKTKSASDPQQHDDPIRHQAMWFNGEDAFLQNALPVDYKKPTLEGHAENRQNFLYFTAEAWVKPDAEIIEKNGLFTVLERAIWSGASHTADESFLRKNFLIGIRSGRWYARFDSTGTDLLQSVEIKDGPEATTDWTHVAVTYGPENGDETDNSQPMALKLYVNGICRATLNTAIQPEHGNSAVWVNELGEYDGNVSWGTLNSKRLISMLIGASARTRYGLVFNLAWEGRSWMNIDEGNPYGIAAQTTLEDYESFFKGYIDEVRIWDGARDANAIQKDVEDKVRYTSVEASKNRNDVFAAWKQGARRTVLSSGGLKLPAQLMYHWSFDHLPSSVTTADILQQPAGFSTAKSVTDAKAIWSRPDGYCCPWWDLSAVRSTVYTDGAWVPWINNTVSHLPVFDLTTADSIYWSENYAGYQLAVSNGYTRWAFPRNAESTSRARQQWYPAGEAADGNPDTQITRWNLVKDNEDLAAAYRFANRDRLIEGADLLPMGGAYPKRISVTEGGMWDDPSASDAWAETGTDADNNGLPDWWEEYARKNYSMTLKPWEKFTWDSQVTYNGLTMPAWQAFMRDQAAGMLSDGKIHPEYADTRDMDKDGIPDWWEDMYGIDTHSLADAKADPDHDGLSNYQEYLIEKDGVYMLNPTLSHSLSGQVETDYFLRTPTGEYLGEVYADHDFMEDLEEDGIGTDRHHYDAYSDFDEDGWTAFSELRYSQFKQSISARFISHLVGEEEVKDCPVPVIHAKLRYNTDEVLTTNAVIVVEGYSGNNLQKSPTARWMIRPGELQERKLYLGRYTDGVVHGTLTPGHVIVGLDTAELEMCFVQDRDLWSWSANGTVFTGTYDEMWAAYSTDVSGTNVVVNTDDYSWDNHLINGFEGIGWMQFSVDHETQKGDILFNHEKVGAIDITTGDFSIDMSKLGQWHLNGTGVSMKQCFFRINYKTKTPAMQNRVLTISLANPDAGTLVEGTTAFVAYIDKDGDGYTPSVDPVGFIKDVAVGWDQVPELVVEMSEKSQAGGKAFAYGPDETLVRVVRTSVNGDETIAHKTVYLRDHTRSTTTARNYVYDADYMESGFGLDWNTLESDVDKIPGMAAKDITSVGYTVITGTGSITTIDDASVVATFTVNYTPNQVKPTTYIPTERQGGIVESARPTFSWTGGEGYTSFSLRIFDSGNKTVYESGLQKLPPKDTYGRYAFTPPVWVADAASTNAFCNLANGSNYTWQVAMFNPKFRNLNEGWSDPAAFTVKAAESNDFSTKFGCAEVEVRYFGRAPGDQNDVIVQLFKNADFVGQPAAQVRLMPTMGSSVAGLTNGTRVVFKGLEEGDYYAIAFLDRELPEQKKDGKRQKYETWGYAANVGNSVAEIWKPKAVYVNPESAQINSVKLYLEDTDINQNGILDFEEAYSAFPADGVGTGDTAVAEDTDGDGMPDKWETKYGLNPYDDSDASSAVAGDVMAFADMEVCLVRVGSDGGKAAWFAVTDWEHEAAFIRDSIIDRTMPFPKQLDATNITSAASVWENGAMHGLGTNVVFAADDGFKVLESKWGTVRLVHAQVYALKGFNPKTAVSVDDAVDTKEFTALDKYLVGAYFNAIGLDAWKSYDLNPTLIDADINDGTANALTNTGDGLADGWELYVMFGKDLATMNSGLSVTDAKISPYDRTDALATAPAAGSSLKLYQEFDNGYRPTDPWAVDTDGDGVQDQYAYAYHLKGDDSGKDNDGDGLSNYAEYLITEVFKLAVCNPDVYATNDGICDYFRKVGDVYLGEIFTDHDQMNDNWEAQFNVENVNRYVYDPEKDVDGDGWSNWAEFKAGTNPELVQTLSIDGYTLPEYPIPAVEAKVVYTGAAVGLHPIVFKAWNEAEDFDMVKAPDAIWTLGTAATQAGGESGTTAGSTGSSDAAQTLTQHDKFIGRKPSGVRTYHLPGGAISEGSIKLCMLDKGYAVGTYDPLTGYFYPTANGEPDTALWFYSVYDKDGKLVRLGNVLDETETVVGSVDYTTGTITIDFDAEEFSGKVLASPGSAVSSGDDKNNGNNQQGNLYHAIDLDTAYYRIQWKSAKVNESIAGTYYLTDSDRITETTKSRGHIREGKNTFICFVDDDENGEYTPGELFGVVRGVDVGWFGATLEVELTETHPIFGRVNLTGENDRQVWYGSDSENYEILDNHADAGGAEGDSPLSGGRKQRVRIDRYAVNGVLVGNTADKINIPNRIIVDKWFDVGARQYLHEGDFMEAGEFDVDWTYLDQDVLKSPVALLLFGGEVNTMTYRVVVDNSDFVHPIVSNRVLSVAFTRHFDSTANRTRPSDLKPILAYGARPVFMWSMNGHNSYTAFKLRILSGSQIVYESPMTMAPAVNEEGYYVYESPVSVGDQTPLGKVLERMGNYTWTVSMYNAKFKTDFYATPVTFTTDVNAQQSVDDHGYGTIDVAVKYAGPAKVIASTSKLSSVAGMIRVQAFAKPDFTGKPVAETFVTNRTSVTALSEIRPNVSLCGVRPGTYYVRAYVDSDGDFEKSPWESWGAAKGSVTVAAGSPVPVTSVWIEDADTDGDWLPDAWEYVTSGKTIGVKDIVVDDKGEIVLKEATYNAIVDGTAGVSTGLSGASLTFFQNLGTAEVLLNLGSDKTKTTIQAIRDAVQKKVVPNTVHVKALVVDAANKKVKLSVGGEVADSIAGHLLAPIYTIPTTTTVTVSIYTKASLVDVNWIWVKDYTATVSTALDTTVEVDIDEDLTSGFYKVEVVQ